MARDFYFKRLVARANLLLAPEIPHLLIAAEAKIVPCDGNLSRARREIEQSHRFRAVREFLDEDKFVARLARNFCLFWA